MVRASMLDFSELQQSIKINGDQEKYLIRNLRTIGLLLIFPK